MASWLVHLSPDQVVRVQALAGDIVLCPCVPLSTQVYKWVLENLMLVVANLMLRWISIPSRGEKKYS